MASAAQAAETQVETWPELQAFVRLSPAARLLFDVAPTRSRESVDRDSADFGIYFDYRKDTSTAYRIGYIRSVTEPHGTQGKVVEHRVALDYNYSWKLGQSGLLTDRTRIDLRDRDDGFSQRVRNRLQYEWETRLGDTVVVPYAHLELFYDTRYGALARSRFESGATFVVAPQVDVTLYLGRQIDTRPSRLIVDGVGMILGLHY